MTSKLDLLLPEGERESNRFKCLLRQCTNESIKLFTSFSLDVEIVERISLVTAPEHNIMMKEFCLIFILLKCLELKKKESC